MMLDTKLKVSDEQSANLRDANSKDTSIPDRAYEDAWSNWPEWVTLALYAAIISFAIPYHESWVDEAQAWQLARSLPLHTLLFHYVRYEGSPGLWHLFLWILTKAHISYEGMHWITGAIAVAGVSIFLLRSPFPRYLKLSLPFTCFLLFQYAMIARNYVLIPGLLFLIAACWKRRPVLIALLLGLLANVALHGAAISLGLAIVYATERLRERDGKNTIRHRELLIGAVILFVLYGFALWTAWPPHDLALSRVRGDSRSFTQNAAASLVMGIYAPWQLSFLFWIAIAGCFHARRRFFYLLPVIAFACFSGAVYAAWWHLGLLVPLVLCLLWITWPSRMFEISLYEKIGRGALVVMAATQIAWSAYAIAYDHYKPYSPDLAASRFLRPFVNEGAAIALTYASGDAGAKAYPAVGLMPYFDRNIFINQPDTFWSWSSSNTTERDFPAALISHPRFVLVESRQRSSGEPINLQEPKIQSLTKTGYELTNVFCGARPERFEAREQICHLIFTYKASPKTSTPGSMGGATR